MAPWLIPMRYIAATLIAGYVLPRLEQAFLPGWGHGMSVASALAFFSAVSSGMLGLIGIVFAISFVVVQFGALAYSPRFVAALAGGRLQYHSLGIFFATFTYALAALIWTDRYGSGTVPMVSTYMVEILLIASMMAFARLIQSLEGLQIHNVLRRIGGKGRETIRAMFPLIGDTGPEADDTVATLDLGRPGQTLVYTGEPRVITRFDTAALVRLAQEGDAIIALECGVGETLVDETMLMRVYGAGRPLPERPMLRAVGLAATRTFEQDPKYAIRLLVDIAIRALSPAINDPTTAVQALDQIEDLLRRLGRRQLEAGYVRDGTGAVRVVVPVPQWQDYLGLAFDEIRQFGATSVQVQRRMRAVLIGLAEDDMPPARREAALRYLEHLDQGIGRSAFDDLDQLAARQEDRQGLGLSRKPRPVVAAPLTN